MVSGMLKKLSIRAVIVAVWVTLIFSFLYSPLATRYVTQESLNVFMWPGVVDPKLIHEFEQKTGIKVNVNYYSANEELIVKLLATKGAGYDLVVPSDYAVKILIENDLLQKIDKSKLDFYDKIHPRFLGLYFDPENDYSIPNEWYILGLGINKAFFKDGLPPASWKLVFDPAYMPKHLGLMNDCRDLINVAMKYKYGTVRKLNETEIEEIKCLLCEQKKNAEAYTDFRGDFFLESGNCPVVMVSNSYIWKTLRKNPDFEFLIPEEGTFLSLENYAIPKTSKKTDQVYQLLNFLFDPVVQEHSFEEYVWLSTRKDATYISDIDVLKKSIEVLNDPNYPIELFRSELTDEQVNEIWLALKSQ